MPDESTPLYLQIVHQVRQLIITHRLDDGARLPAVRPLADTLGVNPGTVVQAYRELAAEGLIESVRGRGTIVRRLSTPIGDTLARTHLLADAAQALAERARALGFGPDEVRHQLSVALLAELPPTPVLFVGLTAAQAQRYVDDELMPRYGGDGVRFVPFGIDHVAKGTPAVLRELQVAYTVVTFVTVTPEVERSLATLGIAAEIIGVTAELSAASVQRLRALDPARRYTVVTEHRAVTTVLAMIELESDLRHDAIEVLATRPDDTLDGGALAALVAGDRTAIFTFGVYDHVAALDLPDERRLELRFALTDSAITRLDDRWKQP